MSYEYKDPIISTRRGDNNEPLVPITESHKIINCKVLLSEIPNKLQGVTVTGNAITWIQNQTRDELKVDEYRVDWNRGQVYFHPDNNGLILTFAYYGSGCQYFPASRVYLNKNGNWTSGNVGDLADEVGQYVDNLQNQITKNKEGIETKHETHLNSTEAHSNDNIINKSNIVGVKSSDALNKLKEILDVLSTRIDNLITNQDLNPDKDSELLDGRISDLYGEFLTLDNRLEAIEKRSKYFNKEIHTVLEGGNEITLTNLPENEHELIIYDTKYGVIWEKGEHWNRNGEIITFTSNMPEDLTFIIYNIG